MPKAKNERFGKFVILSQVGKGGMAEVYKAEDTECRRVVALKVFLPKPHLPPETVRQRWEFEVKVSQTIDHPNVVRVFESGEIAGERYLEMEFILGEVLDRRLAASSTIPLTEKLSIIRQAAHALAAAHQAGIIHRDIKPANILLTYDQVGSLVVKVTDFGIAMAASEAEAGARKVPGTPKYIAPEQVLGFAVDAKIDVFALGVVAYELIADREPFTASAPGGYLKANVEEEPAWISKFNRRVPHEVSRVVDKMLKKRPNERYDAPALARDLDRLERFLVTSEPIVEHSDTGSAFYLPAAVPPPAPPTPSLPVWLWPAAAVAALVLALLMVWLVKPARPPARRTAVKASPAADPARDAAAKIKGLSAIYPEGEKSAKVREKIHELTGAVAETAYDEALALHAQGKSDDALAKLETLVKEFPHTDWAKKAQAKADEIRAVKTPDPSQIAFQAAETLAAQKSRAKAFHAWRDFLAQHGTSSLADAARTKARDLIADWANHVKSTSATRSELEEFLCAAENAKPTEWSPAFQAHAPDALYRLSQRLEAEGKSGDATATLARLMKEHPDSPAAAHAREEMEAKRKALEEPTRVADDFAASILDASLWFETGATGAVRVQDGELALAGECTRPEKWQRGLVTRTFSVASCQAAMAFRVPKFEMRTAAASAEIAFMLSDGTGSSFCVTFNGKWYGRGITTAGKGKALTKAQLGQVKPAFGDEADKPHTLTIRYDLAAQRATGLLDGQDLGSWPLRLQDAQFAFHVAGSGPVSFDVRASHFRCEFDRVRANMLNPGP